MWLTVASAAMSAMGSIAGGIGGYQAGHANAKIADIQAARATEAGAEDAGRLLRQGQAVAGSQRAAAAASGVDVGAGSPLLAVLDTITQSAKDASNARKRGEFAAFGYKAEAAQQRWLGNRRLLTGFMGAGKTAAYAYGVSQKVPMVPAYQGGYD